MHFDPLTTFSEEMARAGEAGVGLPNAVTLATADASGRPAARVVLVKGVDDRGVQFFTNYQSNKAADLAANPHAAMAVYWHATLKQVRIGGPVEVLSDAESDAYFASRPRGSQVGAWASDQSRPLGNFEDLKAKAAEFEARFEGADIPRPPHWGGYRLVAETIEIWTDGESRLHRREVYQRDGDGWTMTLLNP